MQFWIVSYVLFYGLGIGLLVFLLYVVFRLCNSGSVTRLERTSSKPENEGYRVTQGSYGYDSSYTPGNRASSAGPLPVGGRTERSPTRSFDEYTRSRREKED